MSYENILVENTSFKSKQRKGDVTLIDRDAFAGLPPLSFKITP